MKQYVERVVEPKADGDPVVNVYVFDTSVTTIAEAEAILQADGIPVEGDHCKHSHDRCGGWYPRKAKTTVVGDRFVTEQRWYQNI